MTDTIVRLAVIGHTNAGKTSLLRTLMRDRGFGVVSSRPATTRHVEATAVDLGNGFIIELADTPGLEDSMGLLDALHAADPAPRASGAARIEAFLLGPLATGALAQEAKALRQLLASDLSLYVLDAREPVLGKYQDEFSILAGAGKPCLVVLNFTSSAAADSARWRSALQRAGIHNVTAFDTVVFDAEDERRLWQQIALLLPKAEAHCQRLIAERKNDLALQLDTAAMVIAEALIDCVALRERLGPAGESALARRVRAREATLNRDLLGLFRFVAEDFEGREIPLTGAAWQLDPFDADLLRELGVSLGSSAAKGAAAGAVVDALTAFHSLGAATAIGAALGAGVDAAWRLRHYLRERMDGDRYEQLDGATALFIARRAVLLVGDLLRRGHAALSPLTARTALSKPLPGEGEIGAALMRAARHPAWSSLADDADLTAALRLATLKRLQSALRAALREDSVP